jgi:hypothetical protein
MLSKGIPIDDAVLEDVGVGVDTVTLLPPVALLFVELLPPAVVVSSVVLVKDIGVAEAGAV